MNKHRKESRFMLLAAVMLVLGMLLSACGTDKPTGGAVQTRSGIVSGTSATVGLTPCTSCHTVQTTAWLASRHGNANENPTGLESVYVASCKLCHEPNGEGQETVTGHTGTAPRVGCEACHGGGSDHVAAGGAGPIGFATLPAGTIGGVTSSLYVSAQFRTCSEKCHVLLNTDNPAGSSPTTTTVHSSPDTITDTHFAKYMTSFSSGSISGYAMDYASATVCIDCHAPHGTADINREWSASAHADRYAGSAGSGYFSRAWARSNWSCNPTSTAGGCASSTNAALFNDRGFCQRCHTTEGFIAFSDALRSGDTKRANEIRQGDLYFTYSSGTYTPLASVVTFTKAGWKPQMLKCNACHTDYQGTLRNPGPFKAGYQYYTISKLTSGPILSVYATNVEHQYPDIKGSNICITCHSGRENGDTIKALNTNVSLSIFDFSNKSLITSHFLTGGGTLFAASGYEFDGRSYEDNPGYRHKNIGTPKEPGTGSNGPCIGCHMSRPNKNGNHLFMPITRAYLSPTAPPVSRADAVVTGIASEVCFTCHGPNDNVILEMVKAQKTLYKEAREAFEYISSLKGFYFNDGVYQQRDGSTYRAGLISLVTSSSIVTGAVSTFTNALVSGGVSTIVSTDFNAAGIALGADQLLVDGNSALYTIQTVDSATQITLSAPYAGPTAANVRFSILKNESVLFTQNSVTVIGTNTNWATTGVTGGSSGDYIRNDNDGTWYRISARNSDTSLTLSGAYAGATGSAPYTIIKGSANAYWLTPTGLLPDTDVSGDTTGKKNMGALFNLYLFEADPAGYVHNRYYMKRLMYDAIDWLDDNTMNYSTGATVNAICTATTPAPPAWCAGAMEYLLPNGVIPGGVAAERP